MTAVNLTNLALALAATEAGVVTAASTPALDDNTKKLATTEFLLNAFTGTGKQAKTGQGYQKLPGGVIIQWGIASFTSAGTAVTYPIPFPSAYSGILLGQASNPGGIIYTNNQSNTGFTALSSSATAVHYWLAIGY